ncbi:polysaccharide biosynthesis C-terminal domain-containing protein [Lactobacillus delbrueckii]|uniref:polysaccharide biosynthesis C-terminal domain-containing protein n=1 Tax=Lactobacillus delbrueckii TaxID=1584 RepID=UPI001E30B4CB|nr:polysaccharide biosynthesis C-terminal domain-containing protein [Lactobacillus delbrueckii subsp. lactis]
MLLAYLGLAACLLFSSKLQEYEPLIWTLSSGIIFTTLGCEWVYAIHEEYGYLALRNICFQVLSLILLLTYVKDESDLLLYAWTTVAGSAGANLINFLRLRKYCTWSFTWHFSWQKHLLPILVLFANSLVNLLYVRADVAQLGVMTSGDYYVGLYSVASKVTALLKQLLGAVIVVTVPRLACLYGQKGREFFQKLARQEKAALLAISIASVVNVSLNFLLIPAFKEAGAALATLLADLVTCLACYFLAKKSARLLPSGKKLASSLLGCLYVYLVCQAALAKGLGPGSTVFWAALWAIPGYFVILYLLGNRFLLEFKCGS